MLKDNESHIGLATCMEIYIYFPNANPNCMAGYGRRPNDRLGHLYGSSFSLIVAP
jgi:hypothetical protein